MAKILSIQDQKIDVKVNSHHHQSVKNVGKNLIESAWTNDDVIECIESVDKNRFLLGVQWHPEIGFKEDEISKKLFKSFVKSMHNLFWIKEEK